ncbi:MAG: AAA family ATPase [Intrasporangium sp.]|uniref:AAA family ATPase n=1 Tax=Intrasporangium sp. TaxID=1925024 RepID=UPI002648094D|nr:AAA family ATPase [Intrasporangium sp.]MDN5794417.1 AAA family ATPase [Intrasporangium sp.]
MDRMPNPYRPGFNAPPPIFVGRDGVLASVSEGLDVAALDGRTPRPLILTGTRGVGKTVALGEAAALAAERLGWPTVHVEVRPKRPFTPLLVERLAAARDALEHTTRKAGRSTHVTGGKLSATALGVGAEVMIERGADPVSTIPADPIGRALTATMLAAMRAGAGLVLTLDEAQLATRGELAAFTAVLQEHMGDDWPLVVLVAGLPSLRDPNRSVTYLERGEWQELGLLDPDDVRQALVEPAATAGRPMDDAAADILVGASGGYPYAVQLYGHHAWRASDGSRHITTDHARTALDAARRELEEGLYASRWNDASPKEQEYLAAVAALIVRTGEATGPLAAAELGAAQSRVSYLRDRLLKKGTLYAEGPRLLFLTPGMAEWVMKH